MDKKLTLPLEVGKKYLTRDGRVARVICTDRKSDVQRPVVTLVDFGNYEVNYWLKLNGRYSTESERDYDLVADYDEPKLRPWKPEEVPALALFRYKFWQPDCWSAIVGVNVKGIELHRSMDTIRFVDALDTGEHSTDGGKTWRPCGVVG